MNIFENSYFEIMSEINDNKVLTDELKDKILKAVDDFRKVKNG